jgi:hypothetical protein
MVRGFESPALLRMDYTKHCGFCRSFTRYCTGGSVPEDTKAFLKELWYSHQDRTDSLLCWNAYQSVYGPSHAPDCGCDGCDRQRWDRLGLRPK